MPQLMSAPPFTEVEPVTEILHGVTVTDPYRWLEDQESLRTREWLGEQQRYARSFLDSIPGRVQIGTRVRELLDVETYDSIQQVGSRYFFRKRQPGEQQPCIFVRDGIYGEDQLLVDPATRGTGPYTAVKPLRVSPNGQFLLYEVKEGGERTGTFELLDLVRRTILPDVLPRGYLRGFVFAPNSEEFYYVHEPLSAKTRHYRAAYKHILGTSFENDAEIFLAGEDPNLRLCIVPGSHQIGFVVLHFAEKTLTDFHLWPMESNCAPTPILRNADYQFGPWLCKDGRILAITDFQAPNSKIVEVRVLPGRRPEFVDVVPEDQSAIQGWSIVGTRVFVSYLRNLKTEVAIFDLSGQRLGQLPVEGSDTVRPLGASDDADELLFEQESFTKPIQVLSYSPTTADVRPLAKRLVPFDSEKFGHLQLSFTAKDGTRVPIFLVGRKDVLNSGSHPVVMTSYGGFGISMKPQFSAFAAFFMELGCLFALPNIRGGSEFGTAWHEAAKQRHRQVAFDDFQSAALWLFETQRAEPGRLAIFGGSNSGLLVGACLTQWPELFRAVLCMVPALDMLRFHLFDNARVWKDEFGTVDNADDFAALLGYSPYHNVRDGTDYPATMIVSGDADQNCNPLHARKMTARLQAANKSNCPIFLDYSRQRGHSPVLPLNDRIEALTDRIAFLCDQLQLKV